MLLSILVCRSSSDSSSNRVRSGSRNRLLGVSRTSTRIRTSTGSDTFDRSHTGLLRGFLPQLTLGPGALAFVLEFVAAGAELGDGLLGQQLLQGPFLDVLRLVVFELRDELHGAGENAALVLLASGHDFGDFVDSFVDGFASASLD
jgi:hypothetical protein